MATSVKTYLFMVNKGHIWIYLNKAEYKERNVIHNKIERTNERKKEQTNVKRIDSERKEIRICSKFSIKKTNIDCDYKIYILA